jgi:hypothetical protein
LLDADQAVAASGAASARVTECRPAARTDQAHRLLDATLDNFGSATPEMEMEMEMENKTDIARDEGLFWVFLTGFFAIGFNTLFDQPIPGAVKTLVGIVGLAYSIRQHLPPTSYRTWIIVLEMAVTSFTVGYDI